MHNDEEKLADEDNDNHASEDFLKRVNNMDHLLNNTNKIYHLNINRTDSNQFYINNTFSQDMKMISIKKLQFYHYLSNSSDAIVTNYEDYIKFV